MCVACAWFWGVACTNVNTGAGGIQKESDLLKLELEGLWPNSGPLQE